MRPPIQDDPAAHTMVTTAGCHLALRRVEDVVEIRLVQATGEAQTFVLSADSADELSIILALVST